MLIHSRHLREDFDKIFNARIILSACGLLLAGSDGGHAAAMVTGWMSPQGGQIWHLGV